ncbi:orotate phosphoribosyltransferase [Alkalihalobacterium chitinilyticum]|uniref:Orotate phosphoribosyltransferase n=1 Tax=Alkalihalobacterium chitinilyticum TaxID=2980103 RepID=A0ABT5VC45_9BACI|nr:orotate phosphoribosyltransferase [Alkalihalobacterium chitinilyticum]MDE5413029.1 orotate phosphoribosyltransferase [Alkalihalobacterium chitinilyticum]
MKKQIATHLLDINAVYLRPNDPFTWSSGMKSPIYCDNRLTLSYPVIRKDIANGLKQLIEENYADVDVIAGTATAGIPHAAWVSDLMEKPMAYIRSKAKGHGKGNQIEGKIEAGDKVVIVEDLISTGGSVITAAEAVREVGGIVVGVVAIFTYGLEKGITQLEEAKLPFQVLTDYETLLQVSLERKDINEEEVSKLKQWRQNPSSTDWMNA